MLVFGKEHTGKFAAGTGTERDFHVAASQDERAVYGVAVIAQHDRRKYFGKRFVLPFVSVQFALGCHALIGGRDLIERSANFGEHRYIAIV